MKKKRETRSTHFRKDINVKLCQLNLFLMESRLMVLEKEGN